MDKIDLNGINAVQSNISACVEIGEELKPLLGPYGSDYLLKENNQLLVTNDGATLLKYLNIEHPAALIFSEV